jgi:hypothetical protein
VFGLETQIGDFTGLRRDGVDGQSRQVTTIPKSELRKQPEYEIFKWADTSPILPFIALWRFVEY